MKNADVRGEAARKQRRDLLVLWAFFAVWGGGAAAAFYIFAIKAYTPLGAAISGTLALLGAYFIWCMIRMTADEAKFGVVSLVPSPRTVQPGGKLQATLRFHDKAPDLPQINAELRCVRVTLARRSRTGIVPTEETAWSARADFPLRKSGVDARAEIGFDIPAQAPATDLPGERPGESGWQRLHIGPRDALQYHRWELFVSAELPGIDLERNFPIVIEPVPDGKAAGAGQAARFVDFPASARRDLRLRNWALAAMALPVLAMLLPPLWHESGSDALQPAAPPPDAPVPPVQTGELPAQTPWTADTTGWSLPLPSFARHLGVAANGIRLIRENGTDRFVIDEVLIERNPAWSHVDYFDLAFSVTYYPADPGIPGTLGGYSTRLADVRGSLTADNPVLSLRGLSVTVPLPKGTIGRRSLHLGINAVQPKRKYVRESSRELSWDDR